VHPALPQVPQICLRNQNGSIPLWLADTLSANKRLCPMPTRNDTSYFRFYCCCFRWTCTSNWPVNLRCIPDANGRLLSPTILLTGRREWRSWRLPISVPIGPTILDRIQNGVLLRRLFSLMRCGPNTCLLVSTLHATNYHWWNLGLCREAVGPNPSFLAMNKFTQRRGAFQCYGKPL